MRCSGIRGDRQVRVHGPIPRIAQQPGLSVQTIGHHVSIIFGKLQVADRAEAIVLAREAGLGRTSIG